MAWRTLREASFLSEESVLADLLLSITWISQGGRSENPCYAACVLPDSSFLPLSETSGLALAGVQDKLAALCTAFALPGGGCKGIIINEVIDSCSPAFPGWAHLCPRFWHLGSHRMLWVVPGTKFAVWGGFSKLWFPCQTFVVTHWQRNNAKNMKFFGT